MQNIDDFLESLLNEKGITDVEPDVRVELVAEMRGRLLDQIDRAAIMQLSEEQADELEKMMDQPDFTKEKMTEFMQNAGVNFADVALDTMMKFRGYYLGAEA